MHRRDFVRGALAFAGAPLARSAHAQYGDDEEREPRDIKKAVKIGMVREGDSLTEKFRLLADLGFDGVELDSPSAVDPDEVLRAQDATGLAVPGVVCSVHWQKPLSHPDPGVRDDGRAGIETALRDSERFGGSTVLVVPAVVSAEVGYDEAWGRSTAGIRAVLPLAEELGITIALENVWNNFLLSPMEAARYVDQFESERVKWYFDVGNVVNYGWPEQWVRILGHRIERLDFKEFSRKKRDEEGLWKGFGVKLLEGDCNWPAVMAMLDQVGYAGWAVAEVPGGDRERLADIAERMDRIIAL